MTNEFIEAVIKEEKYFNSLGREKLNALYDSGDLVSVYLTIGEISELQEALECYREKYLKSFSKDEQFFIEMFYTKICGYIAIMILKSQEYKKQKGGLNE
jgi:hypothetical protein